MSPAKIDLTGKRFGRLLVLEEAGRHMCPGGRACILWRCKCSCGREMIAHGDSLRSGHTRSCGCLHDEMARENMKRVRKELGVSPRFLHGGAVNGRKTRLYKIWRNMKERCYNQRATGYEYYGGRGIEVCQEWRESFAAFRDWAMANGYEDHLTIDRIDNNKGYSPDNCRWATMHEQRINQNRMKKHG